MPTYKSCLSLLALLAVSSVQGAGAGKPFAKYTAKCTIIETAGANQRVLAEPTLTVEDGKFNEFFAGGQVPHNFINNADGSTTNTYVDFGIKIDLTVAHTDSDKVRVELNASLTRLSSTDKDATVIRGATMFCEKYVNLGEKIAVNVDERQKIEITITSIDVQNSQFKK